MFIYCCSPTPSVVAYVFICVVYIVRFYRAVVNATFLSLRTIFTALHVMQTRYYDEISVRLSVCLSVTRVDCDKTEERSVQIFIPYERTFSLVF